MRRQAWASFWLLGLIWGSSFLFIRIGVREFSPGEVVFIRTTIAAIGLNIVLWLRGKRLPTDRATILKLIVIGLGNVVVPFLLISWSEQHIESSLASVLQSTASLFTLITAHLAFEDERITLPKVICLLVGFIGMIVLASREWKDVFVITNGFLGQMAMVLASLFYAIFATYSRKVIQGNVEPIVVATGTLTTAAVVSGILVFASPLVGGAEITPLASVSSDTLWAMAALGFANTFIAYIMYYYVIRELGAARASMVTYIVPVVGLFLGILFLGEMLDTKIILGALLIFSGIGIVNLRFGNLLAHKPTTQPVK
ncbi:MAG: EamA family transporter [Anaerolineae bacterium]|nr:EamA family transporter [Anaerolineae bacterium]